MALNDLDLFLCFCFECLIFNLRNSYLWLLVIIYSKNDDNVDDDDDDNDDKYKISTNISHFYVGMFGTDRYVMHTWVAFVAKTNNISFHFINDDWMASTFVQAKEKHIARTKEYRHRNCVGVSI